MKKNFDELINKYLDNELSSTDLECINELIKSEPDFNVKFSTQKYVHENLSEMPINTAPAGISEKIMNKLVSKLSSKYQKNYFFRGIVTVFTIILITVLFMFFFYLGDLQIIQNANSTTSYLKNYTVPVFSFISKVITSELFRTISGVIGFVILLTFYFTLNSFKEFKDRIKHF